MSGVYGQRALVGVLAEERRRQAVRVAGAHLIAAIRRLHLHHVRAHQRKLVGAQGAGMDMGEVHHANASEQIDRCGSGGHGGSKWLRQAAKML